MTIKTLAAAESTLAALPINVKFSSINELIGFLFSTFATKMKPGDVSKIKTHFNDKSFTFLVGCEVGGDKIVVAYSKKKTPVDEKLTPNRIHKAFGASKSVFKAMGFRQKAGSVEFATEQFALYTPLYPSLREGFITHYDKARAISEIVHSPEPHPNIVSQDICWPGNKPVCIAKCYEGDGRELTLTKMEALLAVKGLTNGLNHLLSLDIYSHDLKPGNTLIEPGGKLVLSDLDDSITLPKERPLDPEGIKEWLKKNDWTKRFYIVHTEEAITTSFSSYLKMVKEVRNKMVDPEKTVTDDEWDALRERGEKELVSQWALTVVHILTKNIANKDFLTGSLKLAGLNATQVETLLLALNENPTSRPSMGELMSQFGVWNLSSPPAIFNRLKEISNHTTELHILAAKKAVEKRAEYNADTLGVILALLERDFAGTIEKGTCIKVSVTIKTVSDEPLSFYISRDHNETLLIVPYFKGRKGVKGSEEVLYEFVGVQGSHYSQNYKISGFKKEKGQSHYQRTTLCLDEYKNSGSRGGLWEMIRGMFLINKALESNYSRYVVTPGIIFPSNQPFHFNTFYKSDLEKQELQPNKLASLYQAGLNLASLGIYHLNINPRKCLISNYNNIHFTDFNFALYLPNADTTNPSWREDLIINNYFLDNDSSAARQLHTPHYSSSSMTSFATEVERFRIKLLTQDATPGDVFHLKDMAEKEIAFNLTATVVFSIKSYNLLRLNQARYLYVPNNSKKELTKALMTKLHIDNEQADLLIAALSDKREDRPSLPKLVSALTSKPLLPFRPLPETKRTFKQRLPQNFYWR